MRHHGVLANLERGMAAADRLFDGPMGQYVSCAIEMIGQNCATCGHPLARQTGRIIYDEGEAARGGYGPDKVCLCVKGTTNA